MSRLKVFAVLLFVAFIAAEPLVHEHPLQSNEAIVCAACAAGTAQLVVQAPVIVAPVRVAYQLSTVFPAQHSIEFASSLSSRAPPAL